MSERLEVRVVKRLPAFTLDVAWTAGAGVAVLFGPSGAGKTLTLQCLAGLLRPDAGRIVVDGRVLFDSTSAVDVRPRVQRGELGNVYARPGRGRLQPALDGPLGSHANLHLAGDYFAELGNMEAAAQTGLAAAERVDSRIREVSHV